MKKELNIINGGLEPKRPPNIVAEMAKAAQERQAALPEPLKVEVKPEVVKPEYNLTIITYDRVEPSVIILETEEELLRTYDLLHDAMDNKYITQVVINGYVNAIRGKDIKQLMYKLPENVKE
jgi:hypothetical protein